MVNPKLYGFIRTILLILFNQMRTEIRIGPVLLTYNHIRTSKVIFL